MSIDRDVTPVVRTWLEQRGQGLNDPNAGFDRFLQLVDATPQVRRHWWSPARSGATTHTTRRSPSMFSATRLIAAIAVVVLGTGTLFFAASPSPVPVVSPSPSPVPTVDPLSGLVLEEVAPGVHKVLDDGAAHQLTSARVGDLGSRSVEAGPDGSVWLMDTSDEGDTFRLGLSGSSRLGLHKYWPDLTATTDGTLWAVGQAGTCCPRGPGDQLISFTGGERTAHVLPEAFTVGGLEVGTDGALLVNGTGAPSTDACGPGARRPVVGRLADGVWTMLPAVPSQVTSAGDGGSLAWAPDGTAWLAISRYNICASWVGLLRFDGAAWSVVPEVEATKAVSVGPVVVGPDGTVWVYGVGEHSRVEPGEDPATADRWLMRYADGAWTTFSVADGVPVLVGIQTYGPEMEVGPDGTLWIAFSVDIHGPMDANRGQGGVLDVAEPAGPCAGVLTFDGNDWTKHLDGYCATDVTVGPDSRVWATVSDLWDENVDVDGEADIPDRAGLYIIDPEVAVAAGG